MDELLDKYRELSTARQQELLAFVDKLLLREKLEKSTGDLTDYKKRIIKVSVWSEEHIEQMEKDLKSFGQWEAPEW